MRSNEEPSGFSGLRLPSPPGGLVGRLLTIAAGALLLVVGFMFSLLALAVVLVGGLLLLAYMKWKTRHLRSFLNEQMQQQAKRQGPPSDGRVIEGEVIREAEPEANSQARTDHPLLRDSPACQETAGSTPADR